MSIADVFHQSISIFRPHNQTYTTEDLRVQEGDEVINTCPRPFDDQESSVFGCKGAYGGIVCIMVPPNIGRLETAFRGFKLVIIVFFTPDCFWRKSDACLTAQGPGSDTRVDNSEPHSFMMVSTL